MGMSYNTEFLLPFEIGFSAGVTLTMIVREIIHRLQPINWHRIYNEPEINLGKPMEITMWCSSSVPPTRKNLLYHARVVIYGEDDKKDVFEYTSSYFIVVFAKLQKHLWGARKYFLKFIS